MKMNERPRIFGCVGSLCIVLALSGCGRQDSASPAPNRAARHAPVFIGTANNHPAMPDYRGADDLFVGQAGVLAVRPRRVHRGRTRLDGCIAFDHGVRQTRGRLGGDDCGDGDDLLLGGNFKDRLRGGRGDDRLFGGDGNDDLAGDSGNDELFGEDGDDELKADDDYHDDVDGGDGDDSANIDFFDFVTRVDDVNFK